jgi:cell fate regulator YaaT (PSP1 superfamily)
MPDFVVRYGVMRFLGVFTTAGAHAYRRGDRVIIRTDRGLEAGEVLCPATPETQAYLKEPSTGQLLRGMTPDDLNEAARIGKQAREEMDVCQRHVDRLDLKMQLVDVEHIFGGERVVVYYLAENRVNFRELVKTLAGEFQTRVEMRQIGVRDEAKLLADYGDCGCPVCCNTHLAQMPPVSMRMAKLQKATLDPTKISGRCGRLKCCLRYEYELYEESRWSKGEAVEAENGAEPGGLAAPVVTVERTVVAEATPAADAPASTESAEPIAPPSPFPDP